MMVRTSPTRGSPFGSTAGKGGVSRGRAWVVYDHDTLRLAAAWTGQGFIDWNGINFNGRHQVHPRIVGKVQFTNPDGPGWANPRTKASPTCVTEVETAGLTVRCRGAGPITRVSIVTATR